MTQYDYIHRHLGDRFVVWRRHDELVFDGNGKDFLEGTTEDDLRLPISEPIAVNSHLRVLTLVEAGDIWFYYHHSGERVHGIPVPG